MKKNIHQHDIFGVVDIFEIIIGFIIGPATPTMLHMRAVSKLWCLQYDIYIKCNRMPLLWFYDVCCGV